MSWRLGHFLLVVSPCTLPLFSGCLGSLLECRVLLFVVLVREWLSWCGLSLVLVEASLVDELVGVAGVAVVVL